MKEQELLSLLRSALINKLIITQLNGEYKVSLPFTDYMNDSVEISVTIDNGNLLLDDMGHVAGLLFSLGQEAEDTPAHQLVKNLAEAYHVTMDYNSGVLFQRLPSAEDMSRAVDFVKILIALQTAIPELRQYKKGKRGRRPLASRLGKDIKQLRLPFHVERQVEISGKHLDWLIDYKYTRKSGLAATDVLVVAADLSVKEPRTKAEHVLTMAVDLLELNGNKDLRVVYDAVGNGYSSAARRAANLIEDSQERLRYKAFNYADLQRKQEWMSLTLQELLPLT